MRFTHGDTVGRVRFIHNGITIDGTFLGSQAIFNGQKYFETKDKVEWDFDKGMGDKRSTICEVSILNKETDEFEGIAGGFAVCDQRDQFKKSTGRKIALMSALSQIKDRSLRTTIWKEYFKQHNDVVVELNK